MAETEPTLLSHTGASLRLNAGSWQSLLDSWRELLAAAHLKDDADFLARARRKVADCETELARAQELLDRFNRRE